MPGGISRYKSAGPLSRDQPARGELHPLSRYSQWCASPRRNPAVPFARLRRQTAADFDVDQRQQLTANRLRCRAPSIFQQFEIGQILWPARGALVTYERVLAQNENGNAVEFGLHLARKRFIGRD